MGEGVCNFCICINGLDMYEQGFWLVVPASDGVA